MPQCKTCNVYHIEGNHAVCKKKRPDRVVKIHSVGVEQSSEIVNGWPVVDGEADSCGDFE